MIRKTTACLLVLLVLGVLAGPAFAATAEPSLIGQSWYWETQQNENFDTPIGSVSGEAPNPFCPGAPSNLGAPAETCAEGRLPVEVAQGDYETPDKVTALAFDMTMLTVGSKVSSFTVQLLEAESGCREQPDAPTGQQCEETDSRNIDETTIVQACEVTEIFGDGEARVYKEMPKFTCTDADPVGKRKEIENDPKTDPNDPDADFLWTFDLTPFAQRWAEGASLCTCIMLRPQKPKEASDQTDNWRVVFAGPKIENGVRTELKFTPGEGESLPPLPTETTTTSPSGTGSSGSLGPTTTVGGGLDPGTSDVPAGDTGGTAPSDAAAADEPLDAGETEQASDVQEVEAMPGYVWLAILAGLIGFSLVRSVILESVSGRRPNGVLAQIHGINAARGSAVAGSAAAASGPLSSLRSGLGSIKHALSPIGSRVSSIAGKVKGIGKG